MKTLKKTIIVCITFIWLFTACSEDDSLAENETDIKYVVSTIAGSIAGFADGITNPQFNRPTGVAVDVHGTIYIADFLNHKIRKITTDGFVSTLAGSTQGFADGTANAKFDKPTGIAVDAQGNVYVADTSNNRIRKITPEGIVITIAGDGTNGFSDGIGTDAQFSFPNQIAIDSQGNLIASDTGNDKIRKITPENVVTTLAGSTAGFSDGVGVIAQFSGPIGITVDVDDNVYVTDFFNHKIRKITPSGLVSTIAGSIAGFADGLGANAQFLSPFGIGIDTQGNLFVSDGNNEKIRKIAPDGMVSTIAGSTNGFADGSGFSAQFNKPSAIAIDTQGIIYVADQFNHRIRKITKEMD